MTTCKKGDVVLIRFPNSDLVTYKKRPALVVQADEPDTGLSQKIIALITTNQQRTGPTRVPVPKNSKCGQAMNLPADSVIVMDNLTTVLLREIDKVVGCCTDMGEVEKALRCTFGL